MPGNLLYNFQQHSNTLRATKQIQTIIQSDTILALISTTLDDCFLHRK